MNILSSNRKQELPQIAQKNVRKKKNPSCLIRSLQHFVFRPTQPHLTELHCQNLVLIAVAREARPAATHPTKRQQPVPEQNLPEPRWTKLFAKWQLCIIIYYSGLNNAKYVMARDNEHKHIFNACTVIWIHLISATIQHHFKRNIIPSAIGII